MNCDWDSGAPFRIRNMRIRTRGPGNSSVLCGWYKIPSSQSYLRPSHVFNQRLNTCMSHASAAATAHSTRLWSDHRTGEHVSPTLVDGSREASSLGQANLSKCTIYMGGPDADSAKPDGDPAQSAELAKQTHHASRTSAACAWRGPHSASTKRPPTPLCTPRLRRSGCYIQTTRSSRSR
jgi:hypothetical protein